MSTELLVDIVKRYSPSMQESSAVHYLVDWMNANGFDATVDMAGNAVGMRGAVDAPHTLMLLGHIDTVVGEIPVRIEDGKLYGRGSVDAKGSLCTFAAAAAQAEIPGGWRVVVAGAVEEEITTSKGAHHIRETFTPDLCIIGEPSGANRITLGYKGRLLMDYTYSRAITHTARPEPSAGAVGAAFWAEILNWSEAQNQDYDRLFDQTMPYLHSINTTSDGFYERVAMKIGFRLPPHVTPDEVIESVSSLTVDEAELHSYGGELAYQSEKNTVLVRGMLAAIRARGEKPGFVLKSGTSDMNITGAVWECPIVAYGPGDSNLDHTPDEHLPLDEYEAAIATVRHLIENL